jgi:hypothetical protein
MGIIVAQKLYLLSCYLSVTETSDIIQNFNVGLLLCNVVADVLSDGFWQKLELSAHHDKCLI